jgi:DNA (cytosine-5)-methyltransferase 1
VYLRAETPKLFRMPDRRIPVIDLFAGPGGLGEGFASHPAFRIALSIEKDPVACLTLELRAFFRQFEAHDAPPGYYDHLRGTLSREELFQRHPEAAARARSEAWEAELGAVPAEDVNSRIRDALAGAEPWVLIGGPPCQAYSLVGRSRNKGNEHYRLQDDPRATLYRQYLRILAEHHPAVFVMENVRGLLSSKLDGEHVFHRMTEDLQDPARAAGRSVSYRYTLHTLTSESLFGSHNPSDFLIRSEQHGIPQARHRVIIVGLRDDVDASGLAKLRPASGPSIEEVIRDLPRLRSGLSKEEDSVAAWKAAVLELAERPLVSEVKDPAIRDVIEKLKAVPKRLATSRGAKFLLF